MDSMYTQKQLFIYNNFSFSEELWFVIGQKPTCQLYSSFKHIAKIMYFSGVVRKELVWSS